MVSRLGKILKESRANCLAWALLPNHFHLLLRTGAIPISSVMRRLLTGYAVSYNMRHKRSGHLFQNRYKSILCQENPYLLELVRYIHLNPLRAGIVDGITGLDKYRYCGHGVLLGAHNNDWQDADYVLRQFASTRATARLRYKRYVEKRIEGGKRPDLIGGGLVRSVGGWSALKALRRVGAYQKGDERILGDGDFVDKVLSRAEERLERRYYLKSRGYDFGKVVARVAKLLDLKPDEVLAEGKYKRTVEARSIVCFWAARELGISQGFLAREFNVSQPAVSLAIRRGQKLVEQCNYTL